MISARSTATDLPQNVPVIPTSCLPVGPPHPPGPASPLRCRCPSIDQSAHVDRRSSKSTSKALVISTTSTGARARPARVHCGLYPLRSPEPDTAPPRRAPTPRRPARPRTAAACGWPPNPGTPVDRRGRDGELVAQRDRHRRPVDDGDDRASGTRKAHPFSIQPRRYSAGCGRNRTGIQRSSGLRSSGPRTPPGRHLGR